MQYFRNFYIDSCLGLNVFKDKQYTNNQFVVGLYFNYLYLISDIFYKDESREKKITQFSELENFKQVYKRNYIIGTESNRSNSFMNMILILRVYGFNPLPFTSYDENIEYDDRDVF